MGDKRWIGVLRGRPATRRPGGEWGIEGAEKRDHKTVKKRGGLLYGTSGRWAEVTVPRRGKRRKNIKKKGTEEKNTTTWAGCTKKKEGGGEVGGEKLRRKIVKKAPEKDW